MFTSFSTALTGLAASEVGVDVVGNNLANLNTTGYKASTVSFYDLVAESLDLRIRCDLGVHKLAVRCGQLLYGHGLALHDPPECLHELQHGRVLA